MLRYRSRNAWEWLSMLPYRFEPTRRLFYRTRDRSKPYPYRNFYLERIFAPVLGFFLLVATIQIYFFDGFTPQAKLIDKIFLGIMLVGCLAICVIGTWAGWSQYRHHSNWARPTSATA